MQCIGNIICLGESATYFFALVLPWYFPIQDAIRTDTATDNSILIETCALPTISEPIKFIHYFNRKLYLLVCIRAR